MTQDEIISMAREAGLEQVVSIDPKNGGIITKSLPPELLERFAALVAAHEREKAKGVFEELEREVKAELINAINYAVELERKNSAKMQGDCTLAAVLAERERVWGEKDWGEAAEWIRQQEREACAEACLKTGIKHPQQTGQEACAAAIRERIEK